MDKTYYIVQIIGSIATAVGVLLSLFTSFYMLVKYHIEPLKNKFYLCKSELINYIEHFVSEESIVPVDNGEGLKSLQLQKAIDKFDGVLDCFKNNRFLLNYFKYSDLQHIKASWIKLIKNIQQNNLLNFWSGGEEKEFGFKDFIDINIKYFKELKFSSWKRCKLNKKMFNDYLKLAFAWSSNYRDNKAEKIVEKYKHDIYFKK